MDLWSYLPRLYMPFIMAGIVIFTVCLGIAMYQHPGFNVFSSHSSLSDMGKVGDPKAFTFNCGIIVSGAIFMLGAISNLFWKGGDAYKKISSLIFIFALLMFLLIGFFPKGTPYHNIFALSFFLISTIAMGIWCFSSFKYGSKKLSYLVASLVIVSYIIYSNYRTFGFPLAELVGGYSIIFWLLIFRR